MPFEVACSECHGRLLVETPGIVVACPHCGTHLMVPEATAADDSPPTAEAPVPEATAVLQKGRDVEVQSALPIDSPAPERDAFEPNADEISSVEPLTTDGTTTDEAVPDFGNTTDDETDFSWSPREGETDEPAFSHFSPDSSLSSEPAAETSSAVLTSEAVSEQAPQLDWEAPAPDDVPVEDPSQFAWGESDNSTPAPEFTFEPAAAPTSFAAPSFEPDGSAESTSTAEENPAVATDPSAVAAATGPAAGASRTREAGRAARGVSKNLFIAVLSYASAVTIMFVYLLISSRNADPHQLESLPDIVPQMKRDEILPVLVPPDAPMPKGHTLRLNESQRFGNLEVTPVRVTRGPIEFEHFNDDGQKKPAGPPVLKLWLRIRNVATDQVIMPFGKKLVFNRFPDKEDPTRERANNFVASRSDQQSGGPLVMVYNLVVDDVWDLKGQQIDKRLQPNEAFETYIPSEPEAASLDGELVWRVHFRKGYNPDSLRGVTTLIEVVFDEDDIQAAS